MRSTLGRQLLLEVSLEILINNNKKISTITRGLPIVKTEKYGIIWFYSVVTLAQVNIVLKVNI